MNKDFNWPAFATELAAVSYTVTHDDLLDFAKEIVKRTKEMDETEKTEVSVSAEDAYYTRKEVMALVKRCASTMTKWAQAGYLVPLRIGGKFLYRKEDVERILGLNH